MKNKSDKISENVVNLFNDKKFLKNLKLLILILLVLLLVSIFIANLTYYKKCDNIECFSDFMRECSRVVYVRHGEINLEYKIEGMFKDKCEIIVSSLQGETQGMEMTCKPNQGEVYYPEEKLEVCEGELKQYLN